MNVTLTVEQSGLRADQYLAGVLDGLTRSAAQKLLEEGRVLRRGKALKKNDKLQAGDEVAVCIPDPTPVEIVPQDIPLDVVYEDGDVIVVNKPVGMVVHPAPGHPDGTLVNALLYHCGQSLSGINGQLRPGIVHRIDRDTSGLIIAAKNDAAHLALAEQLQDHSLYREYEAVVVGNLREDSGTVDLPIARHPTDRKKMAVNHLNGRRAVTHWTVLARYPGYTHIQCRQDPPDPRAHGCAGAPRVGGPGVRRATQGLSWAGWAVSARPAADLPASPDGGAGHRILPAAGLFPGRLDKMRPPSIK